MTSPCCNLTMYSLRTWRGLEKPVGVLKSETEIQCSGRCNVLGEDCASFHYDHQTQLCTPAKVRLATISVTQWHYVIMTWHSDYDIGPHERKKQDKWYGHRPVTIVSTGLISPIIYVCTSYHVRCPVSRKSAVLTVPPRRLKRLQSGCGQKWPNSVQKVY